jgi:hypothetical protein
MIASLCEPEDLNFERFFSPVLPSFMRQLAQVKVCDLLSSILCLFSLPLRRDSDVDVPARGLVESVQANLHRQNFLILEAACA